MPVQEQECSFKMKNKLLIVYNTCGVRSENIDYYTNAIESLLDQDFEDYRIVVSMFKNSLRCKKALAQKFGNKISYVFYDDENLTINQTFNKTVNICVEEYGKFEGYLYLDSGVTFGPHQAAHRPPFGTYRLERNREVLKKIYKTFKSGPYGMSVIQVDCDAGFHHIGMQYEAGPEPQVKDEDFIVPVGRAVNLHAQIFSHELFDAFDGFMWPDVFAAFCSESTFSFLNAVIHKKWVIMKDLVVHHQASMEGYLSASAAFSHHSPKYGNPWNNLLHGRNAIDFINDPEAIEAGMGYEEMGDIMMHKEGAFDEDGYAKYPEKLKKLIKKHWFLSKEEFDYDKTDYKAIL